MNAELYDLLILGGGPAGLSAALYASRARLRAAVLHDGGGQVTSTPEIENYLGIDSIDGFELDRLFTEHAKRMGAELLTAHAGRRRAFPRRRRRPPSASRRGRVLLRDLRRRVFPQ